MAVPSRFRHVNEGHAHWYDISDHLDHLQKRGACMRWPLEEAAERSYLVKAAEGTVSDSTPLQ